MLYEVITIARLGGLWTRVPVLGAFFLFFSLASLGLPGLNNFTGEILILLGTFTTHPVWAALALGGVVFAAIYMLRLVQGVLWGPTKGDATRRVIGTNPASEKT